MVNPKEPQVVRFLKEPSLAELNNAIRDLHQRGAIGKMHVAFRRPVTLRQSARRNYANIMDAEVRLFVDRHGDPCYTFQQASGYRWSQTDYSAIQSIVWTPDDWQDPAEWARARWNILEAIHPAAWAVHALRADPGFCTTDTASDMKLVRLKNVPKQMRVALRHAFKYQYTYRLKWREKRKDGEHVIRVDCGLGEDHVFRAYYREQPIHRVTIRDHSGLESEKYTWGQAGWEWMLLNPTTMTLPKPFAFGPYGGEVTDKA